MNARQMAALAEATSLTRQGRLLEATGLIQQTLDSPLVTRRTPDAPSDEEETASTARRNPDSTSVPNAREGTQRRKIRPGWLPAAAFSPVQAPRVCTAFTAPRPRP